MTDNSGDYSLSVSCDGEDGEAIFAIMYQLFMMLRLPVRLFQGIFRWLDIGIGDPRILPQINQTE